MPDFVELYRTSQLSHYMHSAIVIDQGHVTCNGPRNACAHDVTRFGGSLGPRRPGAHDATAPTRRGRARWHPRPLATPEPAQAKIAAILQICMSCPYLRETTDRNRPRTMILFATAISRLLGRVRTSCEMFWKAGNIRNATVLLAEGSLLTAGLYRFIGGHEAKIAAILQKCMSRPYLSETTDRNRPRGCKLHASPARLNAPKWRRGCMPVRRG